MSTDSVATLNLEVNTQASLDRMREFENSMASVADGADHAAARVDNMGTMVKNTAVAMGAAFGGMKIAGFLGDAVKESAMFREDVAQFEWVFRKVRGEGEKLIETLTSADYGRSSREAMQMTMSLASMLKGLNLQLSGEFAKMAIDIGSFMSKDPSDVMNAMQSAIMGETMALRTYGVHLTEASIKSVIAEKAANGITYATEREARAFAILSEAQRQQNDAIGDFAVEGGNYRAQINQLTNNITALKVSIGDAFREDVEASLRSLNKFLKWVDEIDPATKKAVVVFGTIGTVLTGMTAAYKVGSVAITMYNASKLASARAAERAAIAQSTEAISTNALTGAISVQTKALQANAMARASVAEASFLGGMGATGAMPVVGVVQGSNAASTLSAKRASADSQLAAAQGRYSAAQGKLDAARHGEFVAKGNVQSAFNKLQAARAGGADASTIKAFEKLHQRYTKQYDGFIKAQGTSHAALLRADTAVIAAKQAQAAAIVKQTALGWNMSTTGAAVSAVPLTAAAPGLMSRMGNGIGRGAMGMGTAGLGMAASAGGAAWGIITAAAGIAGVSVALAGAAG